MYRMSVSEHLLNDINEILEFAHVCYDSSYASSLVAMLTILRAIVDRSSLEHRLVSKSTLFRVSLCFSESYR